MNRAFWVVRVRRVAHVLAITVSSLWVSLWVAPAFGRLGDEIVARPIALARLRETLYSSLEGNPTASDWPIIVQLHLDMRSAYDALYEDIDDRAWKRTHELYDALRFLKSDPNARHIRELFALHQRMADATSAIDAAMFESIGAVIEAGAPDDRSRQSGRVALERARLARAIDRVLQSMPMSEPTGVRGALRTMVAHVEVPPDARAQVEAILDERDRALALALPQLWKDYKEFAVAAAHAFEQVFGGIIPPLGAFFSDEEMQRLRAEMKRLSLTAGNRFLAARARIRQIEDGARDNICALLSQLEAVELRLRLMDAVLDDNLTSTLILLAEENCRAAVQAFGAGDPDHEQVRAVVDEWWTSLAANVDQLNRAHDAKDDARLWTQDIFSLLEGPLGESALLNEAQETEGKLTALIASRVAAAGGSLGGLRTSPEDSKPRLIGGGCFQNLHKQNAAGWQARRASGASLASFTSRTRLNRTGAPIKRCGVAAKMSRAAFDGAFEAICSDSVREALSTACNAAWAAHERAWEAEVEDRLRAVAALELERSIWRSALSKDPDAPSTMNESLRLRDFAFLAGERADEQAFESALACAKDDSPLREAITIARFERFIMRERESQFVDALDGTMYEPLPNWCEVVRVAPLSAGARARVREAMCSGIAPYARACIGRRTSEFAFQALRNDFRLDTSRFPGFRATHESRKEAERRVDLATAGLAQSMLDAAGDERAALEDSMLRAIEPAAFAPDHTATCMIERARAECATDEERGAVEGAWQRYDLARLVLWGELARINLAHSQLVLRKVIEPAKCGEIPSEGHRENAHDHRLAARILRVLYDIRVMLELELESLLHGARFERIAPRDRIDQMLSCNE